MDVHDLGLLALGAPPAEGQSGLFSLLPLLLIFVVFYFLVLAPMRKRQKKQAELIAGLKAGDRVVTNGGIYGTVKGVAAGVIQLKVADQVTIEVAQSAITGLQTDE